VERIRRIQMNDLGNLPCFLVSGLFHVPSDASLTMARIMFYTCVVSRLLHFLACFTAQTHDMRATFWTIGSLILTCMTLAALFTAPGIL